MNRHTPPEDCVGPEPRIQTRLRQRRTSPAGQSRSCRCGSRSPPSNYPVARRTPCMARNYLQPRDKTAPSAGWPRSSSSSRHRAKPWPRRHSKGSSIADASDQSTTRDCPRAAHEWPRSSFRRLSSAKLPYSARTPYRCSSGRQKCDENTRSAA